jgi:hypothetical protein
MEGNVNVRFGSLADIATCWIDVRFTPKADTLKGRSARYRGWLLCPAKRDFVAVIVSKTQGRRVRFYHCWNVPRPPS